MRVLLIQNRYRSHAPSGENIVFDNELRLLREYAQEVITYIRGNDEIKEFSLQKKAALLWRTTWSWETYREITGLIHYAKPDVAHFHNTFALISPAAYYACQRENVPVVQTVHNFRFFCPTGTLFRAGRVCEECLKYGWWKSLQYGCYRNSRLQTLPLAGLTAFHSSRRTWWEQIDIFIVLTEFGREKLAEIGIPWSQIIVKPNFMNNHVVPKYTHEDYVVFVGRLSCEKGIHILLNTWMSEPNVSLKLLGDGDQRSELERLARKKGLVNVRFLGFRPHPEVIKWIQNARFLVMPSTCYETFGLPIIEAFACGKPVVASRLGAMASIIEDGKTGLLFSPGDPDDLAAKVKWLIEHEEVATQMGKAARSEFEANYTAEKNYKMLMDAYEVAIEAHSKKKWLRKLRE